MTIPAIAAVMVAGLVVNHVELSAGRWLELLVVLVPASLPFAALGLLIGYLFDADSAQGAMLVAFFRLAIIGGLWAPISSFPDTLASIGRVLPSFRIADLGRGVVEGAGIDPADVALLIAYAALFGALVAWRYRTSEQRASG
ncbi:MAG TPA: ABC transporter permease [Candidatus Limnocylindrales bacterium]|nr:ABC transporter permease [Candidatus Limnocylindrales bacterium]